MNQRTNRRRPIGQRSVLEVAIEHEHWELAALCLVDGFLTAARKLPPEGVEALIDLLAMQEPARPHRDRERRTRRHGQA